MFEFLLYWFYHFVEAHAIISDSNVFIDMPKHDFKLESQKKVIHIKCIDLL